MKPVILSAAPGLEGTFMDVKDKAPDFSLPDENGQQVSLKGLRGQYVVVYFFPRADTPG